MWPWLHRGLHLLCQIDVRTDAAPQVALVAPLAPPREPRLARRAKKRTARRSGADSPPPSRPPPPTPTPRRNPDDTSQNEFVPHRLSHRRRLRVVYVLEQLRLLSAPPRLHLGALSAPSRLPLGRPLGALSTASRLPLGYLSPRKAEERASPASGRPTRGRTRRRKSGRPPENECTAGDALLCLPHGGSGLAASHATASGAGGRPCGLGFGYRGVG